MDDRDGGKEIKTPQNNVIDLKEAGRKKRRRRLWPARIAAGIVLAGIGITAFVFREHITLYNIAKMFEKIDIFIGKKSTLEVPELTYDTDENIRYDYFGDYIAILSQKELGLYDEKGVKTFSKETYFSSPALQAAGKRLLAYDIGGETVIVTDGRAILFEESFEDGVISAKLTSSGGLAVISSRANYKALVTVYDSSYTKLYEWFSASEYVADADVDPRGEYLAVLTYKGDNGAIVSGVSFFKLTQEERAGRIEGLAGMPFSANYKSGGALSILTESCLYTASRDGAEPVYEFKDRYVQFFETKSHFGSVLLINHRLLGNEPTLLVFDGKGKTIKEETLEFKVKSFTATSDMIALLSDDRIYIRDGYGVLTDDVEAGPEAKKIIISESEKIVVFELNRVSLVE